MAAGLCLIEARNVIAPDYSPLARTPQAKKVSETWHAWLDQHEIPLREAQRLIAEQENPVLREQRMAENREREAQVRREAAEAKQRRKSRETDATCGARPVDNPSDPRPSASTHDIAGVRAIQKAAAGLTPDQVERVLAFIQHTRSTVTVLPFFTRSTQPTTGRNTDAPITRTSRSRSFPPELDVRPELSRLAPR